MSQAPAQPQATTTAAKPAAQSRRAPAATYGPGSAGLAMTPAQFDSTPPSRFARGYRYEVIHGVLVVTPPVGAAEADPNDELGHLLRTYRELHAEGAALDCTMPERTVPGTPDRRRCDRAIWAGLGRTPDELRDVPAIVVEFVSARRRDILRDYEAKRDEYLAAGVREYWVVDRFRRVMTVYRTGPHGPTYDLVAEGAEYRTDILPGFALPLARLLERADRWAKPRRKADPKTGGAG